MATFAIFRGKQNWWLDFHLEFLEHLLGLQAGFFIMLPGQTASAFTCITCFCPSLLFQRCYCSYFKTFLVMLICGGILEYENV